MWVPARMTERYETEPRTITGEATYTNFRRFETDVKLLGVRSAAGQDDRAPRGQSRI
jgi:hypothetical protein